MSHDINAFLPVELLPPDISIFAYVKALEAAKKEIDLLSPVNQRLSERLTLLRKFITAGTVLIGSDIRDLNSRYKFTDKSSSSNQIRRK